MYRTRKWQQEVFVFNKKFSYLIALGLLKFFRNSPRDLHHILLFIVIKEAVAEQFMYDI